MTLKEEIKTLKEKLVEIQNITQPHWNRLHQMKKDQVKECEKLITDDLINKLSNSKITTGIYRENILLPCNKMKIMSTYSSGSYYDKSQTTYHIECDLCGLYQEVYTSYGGYG